MGNVFRIFNGGDNTIRDWQVSNKIGNDAINEIRDPEGADVTREITSIPSPFARIDLVKTAYKEVVNCGKIDGNTMFHKLVSHSLDVAELFFNYDKLSDKISLIVWDRQKNIEELKNPQSNEHQKMAYTLNMYMEQDTVYNFADMQYMYFLKYIGPGRNSDMDIVGATSPSTLFFSSANEMAHVSRNISLGNHRPFSNFFKPLYARDIEFVKFMFLYRKNIPNFATLFPEVDMYFALNYARLGDDGMHVVDALNVQLFEPNAIYNNKISLNGSAVEILGYHMYQRPETPIQSDFFIDSKLCNSGKIPLVLPVEVGNNYAGLCYTQNTWGNDYTAPISDENSLNNRNLPIVGDKYPYLTISDFLLDTIIKLPRQINDNAYIYCGSRDGKSCFLFPLSNLFFTYFTVAELCGDVALNTKMFEIDVVGGVVSVCLRIPIKNNRNVKYIEYRRHYQTNSDINRNIGGIVERTFEVSLFSNIAFINNEDAMYRLSIYTNSPREMNYSVECYSQLGRMNERAKVVRNVDKENLARCDNYIYEGDNISYIRIKSHNDSGVIIPILNNQNQQNIFIFAIDLGTTNTHIEYSQSQQQPMPFVIDVEHIQNKYLYTEGYARIRECGDKDLIPQKIGNAENSKFPTRTALSISNDVNWQNPVWALGEVNIAFYYEKLKEFDYNKIETGLKWSNDQNNIMLVKKYIESMFIIIRNKVILDNGDLPSTKIVWFYPISMTMNRYNLFRDEWNNAYIKYFGPNVSNIRPMTESIAPFEYYKRTKGAINNIVTIDIGGGTTDAVFAQNGIINYITSFRFAANSIFGDGYTHGGEVNGMLKQYHDSIRNVLDSNDCSEIISVFDKSFNRRISIEIASLLFSLSNNNDIKKKNIDEHKIDFNYILRIDEHFKIIFIIFYSAIIYHLANIMKNKNVPMPRHIAFGGNGSKVLQILSTDLSVIANYTKLIFTQIYNMVYPSEGLDVIFNGDNPKEATCKGGIFSQDGTQDTQDYLAITSRKVVLDSIDNSFIVRKTYSEIDNKEYKKQVTESVINFLDFMFNLNGSFSFCNNFGLNQNTLFSIKDYCYKDLGTFMENGYNKKMKEIGREGNTQIEETLFFYPIVGMLHSLSLHIYNQLHS
jgi:hypothetical protein